MFHLTLSQDIKNIFEGFCILKRGEEVRCLYSYPSSYSFQRFYEFIFPCDCPKEKSEEYCLVISNANNDRSFLLCKYLDIFQLYLCIYSLNPWYEIFSKLLFNLSQSDFMPDNYDEMESYLQQIYSSKAQSLITLPPCIANDNIPQHVLRCSLDFPYIYDKYIQEYLTAIKPASNYNKHLWLEIFCSMLLERPIIFMSKRYQKLTSSLLAATFFIHPLSWSHRFISIVPQKNPQLLGMNCCMLGIHSCMEPILEKIDFWNEALLVDLDSGESKMVGASENEKETHSRFKVPKSIKKFFVNHIQLVDESLSSNSPQKIKDLISNIPWHINTEEKMYNDYKKGFHIYSLLFRTIISMIIGNYRQFMSLNEDGYEFEKEKYIGFNPKLSNFLRIFVQSQCFDSFIEEKLKYFVNGNDMNDRFDRERLELTFKIKSSHNKIKECNLFRKSAFTGSHLKTNTKVDRIEKISTMPTPKKQKKAREKRSQTTFHVKSQSLSSSSASLSGNNNLSQENVSDNSESLVNSILTSLTERGIIIDKYRPCNLSVISSNTIEDQDDTLITPTAERNIRLSNRLNDCVLSKSENMLSNHKPLRPIFSPGGRTTTASIIEKKNKGNVDGTPNNIAQRLSVPQRNNLNVP